MTPEPSVSVVIATRNRPKYLARLLLCVQQQELENLECIVIDDGSGSETIAAYEEIWRGLDDRFQLHLKSATEANKDGVSRARNRGIKLARGEFVAFCDDDDLWLRTDHLSTGMRVLRSHGADLYFAKLRLSSDGAVVRSDFYEKATKDLTRHLLRGESDIFEIDNESGATLLRHHTLHCNTIIAAKRLLLDGGLYWEYLYVREDVDFGLRVMDRANKILYRSTLSADYDVTPRESLSRSVTPIESHLFSIIAALHAESSMRSPMMRKVARGNRAWFLLQVAHAAHSDGRSRQAKEFALQSLLLSPTASALRFLVRACMPFGAKWAW